MTRRDLTLALQTSPEPTKPIGVRVRKKRRGFTLVEVMTSAVLLGIGVMATVKVYSAGSRGRMEARKRDLAVRLVERRIESLDARGAERLPACPGPEGCRNEAGELRPPKPSAGSFPCTQLMIEPSLEDRRRQDAGGRLRVDTAVWAHPDPEQRSASRMVTVSACWFDAGGRVKQHSVRRLVLDGGAQ